MDRPKILFLCTGNSIRSQMSEGLLRSIAGKRFDVFSAGVSPSGVHPLTVIIMKEIGIDISEQESKSVEEVPFNEMNYLITLCDHAQSICPSLPAGVQSEHWPIYDPILAAGNTEERLQEFRTVRDELKKRITDLAERFKPNN